ncbi:TdeIII family type II restriction endonuclease, partial [Proteus terrae]
GFEVNNQFKLSGFIPDEVSRFLERTLDDVSYKPNRSNEYRMLSELYSEAKQEGRIGDLRFTPDSTVDVFIKTPDGTEIFIDITTVKPNKKEFRTMKRKILTWYFMRLSHGDISPDKIKTYMAIPYNPESSESNVYTRWNDYYDSDDLLVGDQLWRLVSNDHFSLSDMLDVFVELGDEYQERITNCF